MNGLLFPLILLLFSADNGSIFGNSCLNDSDFLKGVLCGCLLNSCGGNRLGCETVN